MFMTNFFSYVDIKYNLYNIHAHIFDVPCFIVKDGSCSSTYPITFAGIPAIMLQNIILY